MPLNSPGKRKVHRLVLWLVPCGLKRKPFVMSQKGTDNSPIWKWCKVAPLESRLTQDLNISIMWDLKRYPQSLPGVKPQKQTPKHVEKQHFTHTSPKIMLSTN